MRFTDLFVRRPVLSLVVSLLILLIGLRAASMLPVRQFPQLESATITVSTTYPGASPDLMQGFVTAPISQSIATADGVEYLSSSTTQGKSLIQARLRLNANSDRAMTEVIAKINEVKYRLPREVNDPVVTKSTGEPTAVMYLSFVSDEVPIHAVTDSVVRLAQPLVSTVPGVAATELQGGQGLAMRIWLDPARLAARGLSAGDIAESLRRNNVQAAPGQIKGAFTVATVSADTDLTGVESFRRMVIKAEPGGKLVHLEDIAAVELGEQNTNQSGLFNGKKGTSLAVLATPTGNPLNIVRDVKAMLPDLQRNLPPGVEVFVSYDVARFIDAATVEVRKTLTETVVIVIVVIFLFLGSFRSVLIPVVTIPLSLIGSAALMLAFGFSLNLLTLLAMVLAIGLVVDDAIVVVENTYRHIEEGLSPARAALLGAREIVVPVISMTITLAAVYAPIGFLGGLTGALFREFAFTLASAVIISGVVALTLSPMMASFLLSKSSTQGWFPRRIEAVFSGLTRVYARLLRASLNNRTVLFVFAAGVFAGIGFLFAGLKRELAPEEDQATVFTVMKGPQYANLAYTEAHARRLEAQLRSLPECQTTFFINGDDGQNHSFGGINLKDWDKRDRSARVLQNMIQSDASQIEGESVFAFQLPSLPGSTGGLPVQMVVRSIAGYEAVYAVMEKLKDKARKSGLFVVIDSDLRYDNPVVRVRINRLKANEIGVDMKEVADTLAVLVGENYINRFNLNGRSYDVIPQVSQADRLTPESLGKYYVKTRSGFMTPLSTVVEIGIATEPNRLTQFNQQNAATFQAIPAPGVTMGEAVAFLERAAKDSLPPGYSFDWLGDSRQYVQEGNQLLVTFGFALVVIFLVLAAQFESLRDPLIILVTVPLSIFGALIPLYIGYATLNIYTQIGLVTLIGLISKHGILMVEFANEVQRHDRLDRRAAIERASAVRLRPILMTTAATVVGHFPLLLTHGAGAESRYSIGVVLVIGMLVGTAFTLFLLPAVYTVLAKDHRTAANSTRANDLATADASFMALNKSQRGRSEVLDVARVAGH
ncbi:efflux RND transporter permease subunit [Singulisphaera acidiphila]|uniref:Cation/multidrug efflux pump n=1 Tax=Singulisphaera acidiphila (strain ATCC BAA-1392 / DSM 18658 / VKM B-2454 / MOB10) TaxID=886293 RepID=L0DDX2_SINAD|nr:efflux RND transporter permease subunit [Singulisphaera acidiphila]AGA26856.1 cation/multidrug efflux pump [Singulisphaera acidiphila DSM 18658]